LRTRIVVTTINKEIVDELLKDADPKAVKT